MAKSDKPKPKSLPAEHWKEEPDDHDYPAAGDYLSLLMGPDEVQAAVEGAARVDDHPPQGQGPAAVEPTRTAAAGQRPRGDRPGEGPTGRAPVPFAPLAGGRRARCSAHGRRRLPPDLRQLPHQRERRHPLPYRLDADDIRVDHEPIGIGLCALSGRRGIAERSLTCVAAGRPASSRQGRMRISCSRPTTPWPDQRGSRPKRISAAPRRAGAVADPTIGAAVASRFASDRDGRGSPKRARFERLNRPSPIRARARIWVADATVGTIRRPVDSRSLGPNSLLTGSRSLRENLPDSLEILEKVENNCGEVASRSAPLSGRDL